MKVSQGQSLIDIAMQECGTAEAAIQIAVKNRLSVTNDLVTGTILTVPEASNKAVAAYYAAHSIKPATQVSETAGTTIFDQTFDETFE